MLAQRHADSKQRANEHKVLGLTVFVKSVTQQMTVAAQMLKLYKRGSEEFLEQKQERKELKQKLCAYKEQLRIQLRIQLKQHKVHEASFKLIYNTLTATLYTSKT